MVELKPADLLTVRDGSTRLTVDRTVTFRNNRIARIGTAIVGISRIGQ